MPGTVSQAPQHKSADDIVKELTQSHQTFATTLLVWAIDTFGVELLEWHPQTIQMEVSEAVGAAFPFENFNKLLAAISIVTTDVFFKDPARFVIIANTLTAGDFRPDVFAPADALSCAWAVTEALLLNPPDPNEADTYFGDDVRRYIGFILKEEGFVTPPEILKIALDADFTGQVHYNFSDDPTMFGAIWQTQASKTDEVKQVLVQGLRDLLKQLQSLPLKEGNVKELEQRLGTVLRQAMR